MAKLTDQHNPSFVLYPVNNNRTAWRPVSQPVIMVVPHKRDASGAALPNANIFSVRIYIEDVPQEAKVAGHQNIGRRFPDRELYAVTLDSLTLAECQLDVNDFVITRDNTPIELSDAKSGDTIEYTSRSGVRDTLTYLVGADYYDLSEIEVDVELLPSDNYNLVYEGQYFKRVVSQDDRTDFLCIDQNLTGLAIFKFQIDHPGKVMDEFYRLTPPVYLTNTSKAQDRTVAFYRPMTDMLQDVMDEQGLLERINWVFDAPAEAIPYLSSLLGWDIPYFPQSLDQLRRAVLRRTVEFQNLKGSRRAIINIFRLFGFEVLISNLWWSSDGQRLIRPDESLPLAYQQQQIVTVSVDQVDPLLSDYQVSSFTTLNIPLLYRPQEKTGLDQFTALSDNGEVTVTFYAVTDGSPAHQTLESLVTDITNDPATYGETTGCEIDEDGFLISTAIQEALADKELAGYSQFRLAGRISEVTADVQVGPTVPVLATGVNLNRETNQLTITFNGYSQFEGLRLYAFATYRRYEFKVPDVLKNLQSNRFDLQVLTQALDEFADPTTLEFAVEFLYKLKAFHSLLNVIRTRIELTETYEVTDLCVGGDYQQRYDTAVGRLQVPPAIIPELPGNLADCSRLDPTSLGYKDIDIQYRVRQLTNLEEEFKAWKDLDGRIQGDTPPGSVITPNQTDHTVCAYTQHGQERTDLTEADENWETGDEPDETANTDQSSFNNQLHPQAAAVEVDGSAVGSFMRQFTEPVPPFCELDQLTDYCYKGRVHDELLYNPVLIGRENVGIRASYLSAGSGAYWLYPIYTKPAIPGVRQRDSRGRTNRVRFSGSAPEASLTYYQGGIQQPYLTQSYGVRQDRGKQSLLGRLYRDYSTPPAETIHFSNRGGEPIVDQRKQLALQRPSLEITKSVLHLPGCRFPVLNRLKNDFTSDYEARPWDFEVCGAINVCGRTDPDFLNFVMVLEDNGNERLSYDDQRFVVLGNNLEGDIDGLNGQSSNDSDIVHKVYLDFDGGSPAVELDGVAEYDSSVSDGLIDITTPLFSSYSATTSKMDFADGYPAVTGLQNYTLPDATPYDDLLSELGLPDQPVTAVQVLFLLASGILDGNYGYRLDYGCLLAGDDSGTTFCGTDIYRDEDDLLDFEPDHLLVDVNLVADEGFMTEVILLDGTIGSLLETV